MNQLCAHPEVLMSWHHACGGGFSNRPATGLDDSRKPKDGWGWTGMGWRFQLAGICFGLVMKRWVPSEQANYRFGTPLFRSAFAASDVYFGSWNACVAVCGPR